MQNKSIIIILTIVISLICLYSLSFTFISRKVQRQATLLATSPDGLTDQHKKQHYLDSLWEKPVFSFAGLHYTFQEVKERELNLGLDLQGGMYIVLQVSPVEVIRTLANQDKSTAFQQALAQADRPQRSTNEPFLDIFYREFKKRAPDIPLATIFSNSRNQQYIEPGASDQKVLSYIRQEIKDAVDRSYEIISNRIDKFGVTQPNIQQLPGTDRIQLELPGVDNPERVRKLLQGVAKLDFFQVVEFNDLLPAWQSAGKYWSALHHTENVKKQDTKTTTNALEQALDHDTTQTSKSFPILSLSTSSYRLTYPVSDTATIDKTLAELQSVHLLPAGVVFQWQSKADANDHTLELYALRESRENNSILGGDVIINTVQTFENGKPAVTMQMNTEGSRKWKRITADNVGRRIAIVLDKQVYSAPVVQSEIPNGNSSITGNFSVEEAKDLANILKAGKMPATTQIVQEAVVGPSLGKEAITQGLISMVTGLGMVILFMVAYYGTGGLIANIALLFNVFFIIGVLAQFNASLTLPGIAGLVLTIGMSVDANVLIFERIREELSQGKPIKNAIKLGFDKAYSSIIDSNATTFLTGAILYAFGSGGIKGFAVVLMIGIISSLFTAVLISRVIITYWVSKGKKVSFTTPLSGGLFRHLAFDFIGKRKLAYAFSASLIAIGMVLIILQKGLNLGVDFQGGRSYVVHFDQPVAATSLREALLPGFHQAGLEVKTFNENNQLSVTTSYLSEDNTSTADQKVAKALTLGLQNFPSYHPQVLSSTKVGASVAQDVKEAAGSSIMYTLLVIFLYILVRFSKWQYGLGAIVALFHDVLMVFAGYAIARFFGFVLEVDQVFIAAVLTIIGYSINDTVVVFDRIREFSRKSSGAPAVTYNQAINDTLSRTIITSLTVFMVVLVLLIAGGEVLRGFSFALLIGVIFGTYSSIFIASPLALDIAHWRSRKIKANHDKHLSNA